MKYLQMLLFLVVSMSGLNTFAVVQVESINSYRYTDIGNDNYHNEQGRLFANGVFQPDPSIDTTCSVVPPNFVPDLTRRGLFFNPGIFDCPLITPDVLAAISGKPALKLDDYKTVLNDARFQKFNNHIIRSKAVYSIREIVDRAIIGNDFQIVRSFIVTLGIKPKVTISSVDPVALETAGDSGQFVVSLNAPTVNNIRVKFDITGNAEKGKDYQKFPASLIIPAGNKSSIIEVLPVDDSNRERSEKGRPKKVTLKLVREGIKDYTVGRPASATITILDND
jgi:hypothetical protein